MHGRFLIFPLRFGLFGLILIGLSGLVMVIPAGWANALIDWETALFSETHAGDPLEKRLDRLETYVFGEPQSGDPTHRQEQLTRVLGALRPPAPAAGQPAGSETQPSPAASQNPSSLSPADRFDYPTVSALEQTLYSRPFPDEDITARLDRLERKLFRKTFPQMALSDRVDQLTREVPLVLMTAPVSGTSSPPSGQRGGPSSNTTRMTTSSLHRAVDEMEWQTFGRLSEGRLISERLDGLERQYFGATYAGESIDTRITRLQNHLQRSFQSASAPSAGPPIDMLPNDVRTQLYREQGTVNTSFGTSTTNTTRQFTASGPGTVVYQETRQYPGVPAGNPNFRTFAISPTGGSPSGGIGYGSSGVLPPGVVQRPHNLTLSPGGGVYSYPAPYYTETRTYTSGPNYSRYGDNQTVQPYGGFYDLDPAMLSRLEALETDVFGSINRAESIVARLDRLELSLTGRVDRNALPAVRLENLLRGRRLRGLGRLLGM